jgi:hypothetical protein
MGFGFLESGIERRSEWRHHRLMTNSPLLSSRVSFVHALILFAAFFWSSAIPARAAQETFWPFNLFPLLDAQLSYTNDATTSVAVPGVGTITSRRVALSGYSNPIVLPGLGNSAVYNYASTQFGSESSLDGGVNWAPYEGIGSTSLTLRQTNDTAGIRRFEMELSSQAIPVNGAYGAATVRESPALASLGELVVTTTNGGFFYRGFANLFLEVSVDNGANWAALSPAAYVELAGSAGAPTSLSISNANNTVMICWRTEAAGQYQLQKISTVGGTNWTNVGSPQAGNGAEVCVSEAFNTATNQFYRVQLSP